MERFSNYIASAKTSISTSYDNKKEQISSATNKILGRTCTVLGSALGKMMEIAEKVARQWGKTHSGTTDEHPLQKDEHHKQIDADTEIPNKEEAKHIDEVEQKTLHPSSNLEDIEKFVKNQSGEDLHPFGSGEKSVEDLLGELDNELNPEVTEKDLDDALEQFFDYASKREETLKGPEPHTAEKAPESSGQPDKPQAAEKEKTSEAKEKPKSPEEIRQNKLRSTLGDIYAAAGSKKGIRYSDKINDPGLKEETFIAKDKTPIYRKSWRHKHSKETMTKLVDDL